MAKIIDTVKNTTKALINHNSSEDQTIVTEIEEIYAKLSPKWQERILRYGIFESFIKGRQWKNQILRGEESMVTGNTDYGFSFSDARPQGMKQVTFNKCGPATQKFVEFLNIRKLSFNVPKPQNFEVTPPDGTEDSSSLEDSLQVDLIEKLGREILYEDNQFYNESSLNAWDGAEKGDFVTRTVWNPNAINKSGKQGKVEIKRINPQNCLAWFTDSNHTKLKGLMFIYRTHKDKATQSIKDGGFGLKPEEVKTDYESDPLLRVKDGTDDQMVTVRDTWFNLDEEVVDGKFQEFCTRNVITVGNKLIQDETKKGEPFPYDWCKTIERPNDPFGNPFLIDGLQLQCQINEALSDEAAIIEQYSMPWIVGVGTGLNKNDLKVTSAGPKFISINEGGNMYFLEWKSGVYAIREHIQFMMRAFDDVVGMPAIAYGVIDSSMATGVALTTSFQPTVQKLADWSTRIERTYKSVWKKMMVLAEKHRPDSKTVINGYYNVEVIWGERAPRDQQIFETMVINAKNAKLISRETAIKVIGPNYGVTSPVDEQVRIAQEDNDPYMNPADAIAKIQALIQVLQAQAQLQQLKNPQPPTPPANPMNPASGQPTAAGSETPNMTPNMNSSETPMPMAMPGEGGNSYQQPQNTNSPTQ